MGRRKIDDVSAVQNALARQQASRIKPNPTPDQRFLEKLTGKDRARYTQILEAQKRINGNTSQGIRIRALEEFQNELVDVEKWSLVTAVEHEIRRLEGVSTKPQKNDSPFLRHSSPIAQFIASGNFSTAAKSISAAQESDILFLRDQRVGLRVAIQEAIQSSSGKIDGVADFVLALSEKGIPFDVGNDNGEASVVLSNVIQRTFVTSPLKAASIVSLSLHRREPLSLNLVLEVANGLIDLANRNRYKRNEAKTSLGELVLKGMQRGVIHAADSEAVKLVEDTLDLLSSPYSDELDYSLSEADYKIAIEHKRLVMHISEQALDLNFVFLDDVNFFENLANRLAHHKPHYGFGAFVVVNKAIKNSNYVVGENTILYVLNNCLKRDKLLLPDVDMYKDFTDLFIRVMDKKASEDRVADELVLRAVQKLREAGYTDQAQRVVQKASSLDYEFSFLNISGIPVDKQLVSA